MLVSLHDVLDYDIKAIDGNLGKGYDLLIDDRTWTARFLVVDTNSWLPMSHKALISPVSLQELQIENQEIVVSMTTDEIKSAPSVDSKTPVSREFEKAYFDHFGYGYYWVGPNIWGDQAYPSILPQEKVLKKIQSNSTDKNDSSDNHLRSIREIKNYGIIETDGAKGHVYDFVLDTHSWSLLYVVVDTRDWFPGGKKVLMLPHQFAEISWSSQALKCELTLNQVKACPEYLPNSLNNIDYLNQVKASLKES